MRDAPPSVSVLTTCTRCRRLHAPRQLLEANPVCTPCRRARARTAPAARRKRRR